MASRGRPEHQGPPEFVYSETEAHKYSSNSRIIEVQQHLSERAIEILSLPEDVPCMILDIGCGSGLSGECLTEANHVWTGIDISRHMLEVAIEREVEGGLILGDMGYGMPFRPGMFDGVISISALQWLCNADKEIHNPTKRLFKFFTTLYSCMSRGARAVFQFYPENEKQINLILQQSIKAGFEGGLVVDYPNSTKAKKIYLFLYTGGAPQDIPKGLEKEAADEPHQVDFTRERLRFKDMKGKSVKKSRDWIMEKKEKSRKRGKDVKRDSKFTGRKRPGRF